MDCEGSILTNQAMELKEKKAHADVKVKIKVTLPIWNGSLHQTIGDDVTIERDNAWDVDHTVDDPFIMHLDNHAINIMVQ